jgi:hypothetical protein
MNRFTISEIEDSDGMIVEWIVSDSQNEFDPCSFDTEEKAKDELEILIEQTA